jgi:uncharacterized membrane protein
MRASFTGVGLADSIRKGVAYELYGRGRALGYGSRLPEAGGRGRGSSDSGLRALWAAVLYVRSLLRIRERSTTEIRLSIGSYLALGLEFQIGSDILATAVAPTIEEVVLLAAIVVIRTVLNYFLNKEIERERREVAIAQRGEAATSSDTARS